MKRFTLFAALGLLTCHVLIPASRVLADEPATMNVKETKPPAEVSETIRGTLDGKAIVLSAGDKPFYEFWFRKPLPLAKQPAGGTLALDTVVEGTVLGVLKVDVDRRDFRDEELPKGVYVIRLGIQPEDGNHQGVAPTRTFALLIPAKQDTKLDPVAHKDLMKIASVTNAAHHPSNLNLQPVDEAAGEFPRLGERNDGQQKVVLVKLPAKIGDKGEETTLMFAIVYDGTGTI